MSDSIFTKIIKGDIPAHVVYQDDDTIAFMDINPVQDGMVLVVPKVQIDNIEDLDPKTFQKLMSTVQMIAKALRKTFPDKAKVAIQVEGLEVPHAHVKLFPIDTPEDFRALPKNQEPNHAKLSGLTEKIWKNLVN